VPVTSDFLPSVHDDGSLPMRVLESRLLWMPKVYSQLRRKLRRFVTHVNWLIARHLNHYKAKKNLVCAIQNLAEEGTEEGDLQEMSIEFAQF
jgi:hypothetical protein